MWLWSNGVSIRITAADWQTDLWVLEEMGVCGHLLRRDQKLRLAVFWPLVLHTCFSAWKCRSLSWCRLFAEPATSSLLLGGPHLDNVQCIITLDNLCWMHSWGSNSNYELIQDCHNKLVTHNKTQHHTNGNLGSEVGHITIENQQDYTSQK